jgi:hypothetical protein
LTDRLKLFKAAVHKNPNFPVFMELVESQKPLLPTYNPNDHSDGSDDWKYMSGMSDGYKHCLSLLGVELDE